jgi:hypothetical protein
VEFLVRHAFGFDKVFRYGVQYLSRVEEDYLRKDYVTRTSKSSRVTIELDQNDTESREFIISIRKKVDAWLSDKEVIILLSIYLESG